MNDEKRISRRHHAYDAGGNVQETEPQSSFVYGQSVDGSVYGNEEDGKTTTQMMVTVKTVRILKEIIHKLTEQNERLRNELWELRRKQDRDH